MPPSRDAVQEGSGISRVGIHRSPSIVSARNRQLRGCWAASCFGAAGKRIQLWPTAAQIPPAAPSPGESTGLKDTGSLVCDPTAPGLGCYCLPTQPTAPQPVPERQMGALVSTGRDCVGLAVLAPSRGVRLRFS